MYGTLDFLLVTVAFTDLEQFKKQELIMDLLKREIPFTWNLVVRVEKSRKLPTFNVCCE